MLTHSPIGIDPIATLPSVGGVIYSVTFTDNFELYDTWTSTKVVITDKVEIIITLIERLEIKKSLHKTRILTKIEQLDIFNNIFGR